MDLTERIFKAALAEKVTGINAVTLRSHRRRGFLTDLGFEPDGTMARYSYADLVVLTTAVELERRLKAVSTDALETAITLRHDIAEMLAQGEWQDWAMWVVFSKGTDFLGNETEEVKVVQDLAKWAEGKHPAEGLDTVMVVVNLSAVARITVMRLRDAGVELL